MPAAVGFYREKLGFEQIGFFELGPEGPAYATLRRDGCELHLSSFPGDGTAGSVIYLRVLDIEGLRAELIGRGWDAAATEILEQTWGTREIYLADPDGNRLRFGM